ncbi:sugar phosphate isomerase/epimerase [Exilibacterium tricleocarpae]|uniref:Sugar phosphate isomerase/epimerase n=1 Tax=Exilibacterium tricleocarpae TaxID=2591008 RepID=A0A545SP14_9GAMM|nr:sugar phosphate isomerase/epimerase [Exilibacterium tricleocarpae]TQV66719.1 sugar phosphate isomerase/epimerase [Exilibacterium tricleocarpae]
MSQSRVKGPAIFLAQFLPPKERPTSLREMTAWAGGLGYKGVQIPTWDKRIFDLDKASSSQAYCEEVIGICRDAGVELVELSTHLQGQLVAAHPAYIDMLDAFAPSAVQGDAKARAQWARSQLLKAAQASAFLGLKSHATFSGALLWHTFYPWPKRPENLIEDGFKALAELWLPILDAFDAAGVDICYELHPGEDLHDGVTFERFLAAVNDHPRVNILYDPSHFLLQQLDYLAFIDIYHDRIKSFHVKDAEFRPSGRAGVYGGYSAWIDRPGRFRSLGDGQIDFRAIFSKLTQYGYENWAILEWECCLKHPEQGAEEGVKFIADHLIRVAEHDFDDFAGGETDSAKNRRILGLGT